MDKWTLALALDLWWLFQGDDGFVEDGDSHSWEFQRPAKIPCWRLGAWQSFSLVEVIAIPVQGAWASNGWEAHCQIPESHYSQGKLFIPVSVSSSDNLLSASYYGLWRVWATWRLNSWVESCLHVLTSCRTLGRLSSSLLTLSLPICKMVWNELRKGTNIRTGTLCWINDSSSHNGERINLWGSRTKE